MSHKSYQGFLIIVKGFFSVVQISLILKIILNIKLIFHTSVQSFHKMFSYKQKHVQSTGACLIVSFVIVVKLVLLLW